jgi:hypothetical protein
MPCAAIDLHSLIPTPGRTEAQKVDVKDIFYMPLYLLEGLDKEVDLWISSWAKAVEDPKVFELNLGAAAKTPWASLGFPNLDDLKASQTAPKEPQMQITLRVTGIKAFDVHRGLW